MAQIRKMKSSWQVCIRKKNMPHVYKTFKSKADASRYAQESELKIQKGIFDDMTEAHQTSLKDALVRYRDEITPNKKGAKQETYKINKLIRNNIDPDKHMARLNHLGLKAEEHKMFGIAGQMEIARGKVAGYYVERVLNRNVEEETDEELEKKMKLILEENKYFIEDEGKNKNNNKKS